MDAYKPKLSHATLTAALTIFFAGLYAYPTRWDDAWLIGGVIFGLLTASIVALIFVEQRRIFYHSLAYFADSLSKLNPEQYQALGIRFPHLRIRWRGEAIQYFEDTGATMENFARFMSDSSIRQISPERNWNGGPDRRAWAEIKGWLEEQGYIYQSSAAGNHSWLWRGNTYAILKQRYLIQNEIEDLNAAEA